MESLKIIALGVLAAVFYGIANNLVTANYCIEFFRLFPIDIKSSSPLVIALVFGVLTTWWVGLILGILAAVSARMGSRPKLNAPQLVKPVVILVLCVAATALAFGVIANLVVSPEMVNHGEIRDRLGVIPEEKRESAFVIDAAHSGAYLAGAIGGIILSFWIILKRASVQPRPPSQPVLSSTADAQPEQLTGVRDPDVQPGEKVRTMRSDYPVNALAGVTAQPVSGVAMLKQFTHGRALVIGVANYPLVSKLPETVLHDARDIGVLLKSEEYCGYPSGSVKLLLDGQATAAGIRAGLRELAQAAGTDDTAVVFFSGHGGRVEAGPEVGNYLIPFDCHPKKLKDTAIGADEFTTLLSGIKAGRLVVLLDACHAAGAGEVKALDPAAELKAGLDERTYSHLAQGAGRVIVASSRSTEVSLILPGMRNSLFTHYLLEALRGAALNRGDGLVRVFDVFHYISDTVPERASQHPIFKAHDVETNFPLALDRGGKRLAPQPNDALIGLAARPTVLSGKARIEIRRGLVTRWTDLAEFLEVPLADRSKFGQGVDAAGKLLDWLEERRKLGALRDAFNYLGWDDLIEVLARHTQ